MSIKPHHDALLKIMLVMSTADGDRPGRAGGDFIERLRPMPPGLLVATRAAPAANLFARSRGGEQQTTRHAFRASCIGKLRRSVE